MRAAAGKLPDGRRCHERLPRVTHAIHTSEPITPDMDKRSSEALPESDARPHGRTTSRSRRRRKDGRRTVHSTRNYNVEVKMCSNCQGDGIDRRNVLKLGAAGLVAIALDGGLSSVRAADAPPTALTPDEALNALKTGNERYVSHP